MRNRMDKYNDSSKNQHRSKRTMKNQELYDNFYTKNMYFDDASNVDNAYELDTNSSPYSSRSNYQKVKDYRQLLKPREISSKEELKKYLELDEEKNYDLDEIIKRAKQNRQEEDQEEERKRKLKNNKYNIFNGNTLDDLKKRKEQIDKEKSEIEDLINTISSKTLREDIEHEMSKDLLSDLVSEDEDDRIGSGNTDSNEIITESVSKLILDKEEERKAKSEISDIDRSFYTKSMDLSEEDFEFDDDFDELKEKKHTGIKIFLILILLIVIAVAVYLIVVGK